MRQQDLRMSGAVSSCFGHVYQQHFVFVPGHALHNNVYRTK